MQIAAILPQSTIDYPGKLACVLFTRGCNFRCWYCHNYWLVKPTPNDDALPTKQVFEFLIERGLWLDGVAISGGEPTIHKELPDFLGHVKALGYSIKLDTNGSNPEMLEHILTKNLVDFVAMDIKTLPVMGEYSKIIGIPDAKIVSRVKDSIRIIKKSGVKYQFRTTWLPGIHNQKIIETIQLEFLGGCTLKINTFTAENGILKKQLNDY